MLFDFCYEAAVYILLIMTLLLTIYIIKTVREYIILWRYKKIKSTIDEIADGNYKGLELNENEKDINLKQIHRYCSTLE